MVTVTWNSYCNSVSNIPARSLTSSYNLHDLPSSNSKIFCNRVSNLDFRQLMFLNSIFFQQLLLLVIWKHTVLRHKNMLCYVDLQVIQSEYFQCNQTVLLFFFSHGWIFFYYQNSPSNLQSWRLNLNSFYCVTVHLIFITVPKHNNLPALYTFSFWIFKMLVHPFILLSLFVVSIV